MSNFQKSGVSVNELKADVSFCFSDSGLLGQWLQDSRVWPALCKGGLENTIRDLLICELQRRFDERSCNVLVTGERRNYDVAVYSGKDVECRNWNSPELVIEIKFNYRSQLTRERNRMKRAFKILSDYFVERNAAVTLLGLYLVLDLDLALDDCDTRALIHRYWGSYHGTATNIEERTKDIHANLCREQAFFKPLEVIPTIQVSENSRGSKAFLFSFWATGSTL